VGSQSYAIGSGVFLRCRVGSFYNMDSRHGHAVDASLSVAMIPLDCKSGGWQVLETVDNMAQLCLGSHDLQARRGEGKRERERA
jgi:hypothetical protein